MNAPITLTAAENDSGRRLDRILRKRFPAFPLSFINRLLRKKKVSVNGTVRDGGYHVVQGDCITVKAPEPPDTLAADPVLPEPPSLRIIYEDDCLLAVDKPKGVLTHGEDSLETAVSAYLADKIPASLSFRPGPLHRLDRNTSGLVVFGKSLKGARFFTEATRRGQVTKYYLALVDGCIEEEAVWEDCLVRDKAQKITRAADGNAAKARTCIRPLEKKHGATLIEAEITSGKTHQIRAQCAIHGHPLRGDKKYGGTPRANGYFLRAYKIIIQKDGGPLVITVPDLPAVRLELTHPRG